MPPLIIPSAVSILAADTGLSEFVPSGAASSPSFSNGLSDLSAIPTNQSPNFNSVSTQPLRPGAVPKPPLINFQRQAEFGFGENNIAQYLDDLKQYKDQNIAFQVLVNKVVGQTFTTPGGINPRMNEIRYNHYDNLNKAALNYIKSPYDGGARTAFYKRLLELLETIKPGAAISDVTSDVTSAATSAAISDATSDATSDAKRWWQLWGGRKTARNSRSRSRGHKRSRGRSRKQYKKLKRSSRNRHR